MLKELFQCIDTINENIDGKVFEILVRQSNIFISLERKDFVLFNDIQALNNLFSENYSVTSINNIDNQITICFDNLSEDVVDDSVLGRLHKVIFNMAEVLCSCPALSYAISDSYVKIYIDIPNLHISNVNNVKKFFNSDGVIEIGSHTPYLLFVKDW